MVIINGEGLQDGWEVSVWKWEEVKLSTGFPKDHPHPTVSQQTHTHHLSDEVFRGSSDVGLYTSSSADESESL